MILPGDRARFLNPPWSFQGQSIAEALLPPDASSCLPALPTELPSQPRVQGASRLSQEADRVLMLVFTVASRGPMSPRLPLGP